MSSFRVGLGASLIAGLVSLPASAAQTPGDAGAAPPPAADPAAAPAPAPTDASAPAPADPNALARMDGLLYDQLLRFVGNQERDLPPEAETALLVGHNPGLADLVARAHGGSIRIDEQAQGFTLAMQLGLPPVPPSS